jgi:hypothetical protein
VVSFRLVFQPVSIPLFPINAKFPAYLILVDLIILIMLGDKYMFEAPHHAAFSKLLSPYLIEILRSLTALSLMVPSHSHLEST